MTITFILNKEQKPTEEQLIEVREASKRTIEFDEDCPELSPALQKAFKSAAAYRNRRRKEA